VRLSAAKTKKSPKSSAAHVAIEKGPNEIMSERIRERNQALIAVVKHKRGTSRDTVVKRKRGCLAPLK